MRFVILSLLLFSSLVSAEPTRVAGEFRYTYYLPPTDIANQLPPIPPLRFDTGRENAIRAWTEVSRSQTQFESVVDQIRPHVQRVDTFIANISSWDNYYSALSTIRSAYDQFYELQRLRNQANTAGAHNFQSRGGGGSIREELDYNILELQTMLEQKSNQIDEAYRRFYSNLCATPRGQKYIAIKDPFAASDKRHQQIIQMVANGNPCHGCVNPNCNRDYFRREARRISAEIPICPCSNDCDAEIVAEYETHEIHRMRPHRTITREQMDPPLQSSYPETAMLGAVGLARAAVAEGAVATMETFREQGLANLHFQSISTPFGEAVQDLSAAALNVRSRVMEGVRLYKIGTRNTSQTGSGSQFWSTENPLTTPGFFEQYGIPQQNINEYNFVEIGTLRPETPFVTRFAPGVGSNGGGAIEVVVPNNGIIIEGHLSL